VPAVVTDCMLRCPRDSSVGSCSTASDLNYVRKAPADFVEDSVWSRTASGMLIGQDLYQGYEAPVSATDCSVE
jgi:hypothetical protein